MTNKKYGKILITTMLIFVILVSTAAAAPLLNKGAGKKNWKYFNDVTEDLSWAKDAIDKMYLKGIIKGYGPGIFKPKHHVTQLESIIFALRVMGWEDEALKLENIPAKVQNIKSISWILGYNYVAEALEQGILTEDELYDFNPNKQAKRYDVAKYIIRALGMEEEAQDKMNVSLAFKDAKQIPKDAVGYVALAYELELMVGDDKGKFYPNKPVTRAEMAVLISRIDEGVEIIDKQSNIGEIVKVDVKKLSITVLLRNNVEKTYKVIDQVPVYIDKSFYDLGDLKQGDMVQLIFNDDGKVIFIHVREKDMKKLIKTLEGEITSIKLGDDPSVTIKTYDKKEGTYKITKDSKITIDGRKTKIRDLEIGDRVKARVRANNEIVELSVIMEEELEGELVYISQKTMTIKIETDKGKTHTFKVDEDAKIYKDNKKSSFEDLEKGDYVELIIYKDEVTRIDAESAEEEITELEGILKELTIGKKDYIVVLVEDEKDDDKYVEWKLELSKDVIVKIDGKKSDLRKLETGFYVELEIKDGLVLVIEAEKD
ncbi:MAG TPA: hypothetical protein GXZ31_02575 [Thermoanaerobacterales bacterium]|nr:hypothetical protein [Thermoanaerobacterales bacterium]